MELEELRRLFDASGDWEYELDDAGMLIRNTRLGTLTHATFRAIEENTLATLTAACAQGRDVDHITRVTGYFSRTSGWNKGKTGELRDRHRSRV
jgi:hypothetical protein